MRLTLPAIASLALMSLLSPPVVATDKPVPAKAVFVISGLECGSCVYMVQYTLSQMRGIAEAEVLQGMDNFATVSFDPKVISEHQIAQALRDAPGLHGAPYVATMKLRVSGYAKNGNAARVKALFGQWKPWIEMVVCDEREGELLIHFNPLEKDAKGAVPRGWSPAQLTEALQAPALKDLGLTFEMVEPAPL